MKFLGKMVVGALCVSGCMSSASTSSDTISHSCPKSSELGQVIVLAASSMANVLQEVKSDYLAGHPCVTDLVFSFGSSATLATQIVNGSPADVFVSASKSTMDTVKNAGIISAPLLFAKNFASVMFYKNSIFDGRITSLLNLSESSNPGIKVGLCVETAPCGSLADSVLENARAAFGNQSLQRSEVADTETPSVEDLVSKIEMGELDAGIVYKSDCYYSSVHQNLNVCADIPNTYNGRALNVATEYYVGAVNSKSNARDFANYVASSSFQELIQSKFGFSAP
jgi:molybdate transport system substrate-binding protein